MKINVEVEIEDIDSHGIQESIRREIICIMANKFLATNAKEILESITTESIINSVFERVAKTVIKELGVL